MALRIFLFSIVTDAETMLHVGISVSDTRFKYHLIDSIKYQ